MSEDSVETKTETPAIVAPDISEARHRWVAVIAGLPVVYLCSPLVLQTQGNRSLLEQSWRETWAFASLMGVMIWPILVGFTAFVRAIKGVAPGKYFFWVPGVALGLMSFAVSGLLIVAVIKNGGVGGEPVIWMVLAASLGAVFTTVRGFFRSGFRRFNHLLAAIWFLSMAAMFAIWSASPSLFRTPSAGMWLYCFANTMLLPLFAYAFLPRKNEV